MFAYRVVQEICLFSIPMLMAKEEERTRHLMTTCPCTVLLDLPTQVANFRIQRISLSAQYNHSESRISIQCSCRNNWTEDGRVLSS